MELSFLNEWLVNSDNGSRSFQIFGLARKEDQEGAASGDLNREQGGPVLHA